MGSKIRAFNGVVWVCSLVAGCGDTAADRGSSAATDTLADGGASTASEQPEDSSEPGASEPAAGDGGAAPSADDSNATGQPDMDDDADGTSEATAPAADDTIDPLEPAVDGGAQATETDEPTLASEPQCEGESLSQDTTLDVSLHGAVTLSGNVTVNGEALLDAEGRRGLLLFVNDDRDQRGFADLGSTGPSAYSVALSPGNYSIVFQHESILCQGPSPGQMPCSTGIIVQNLVLREDAELDIDLPRVEVAGVVTSGGLPLPGASQTRGALTFVKPGWERSQAISLQTSGDVTFHKSLLAGTYDVLFSGNLVPCELSSLPCNTGLIARDVEIAGSRSFDIDIPVARVEGTATLNGAELDSETSRGSVHLAPAADAATSGIQNSHASVKVADSGPASYVIPVVPGSYDLYFDADNQGCLHGDPPINPCVAGKQLSGIEAQASSAESSATTADFDLSSVNVKVYFTLNGEPNALDLFSERWVRFDNERGGSNRIDQIQADTDGPYAEMRVQKGTYAISLDPLSASCLEPGNIALMPCNSGVLASGVSITEDTTLELDVKVAKLSGAVTLNGGELPSSAGYRGPLMFFRKGELPEQALSTANLGMAGPATYTASLWPGEYEIWWDDEYGNCETGENPPKLPCTGGYLKTVSVTGDQVLDVDIPTVNVTGVVSYGNAALPDTDDHGSVLFAPVGADWLPAALADVDEPVSGQYSVSLIPGSYTVSYGGAGTCDASTEPGTQCADEGLFACTPEAPSPDTMVVVRPPAKPGTVTPPVVDPVEPEPDAGVGGPTAQEMVLACQLVLDHAISCTAGTAQADLFTASLGFCDANYGDKYAACDTAETTFTRATECSGAPCEEAADCTTVVLARYALCRQ